MFPHGCCFEVSERMTISYTNILRGSHGNSHAFTLFLISLLSSLGGGGGGEGQRSERRRLSFSVQVVSVYIFQKSFREEAQQTLAERKAERLKVSFR